jgi:hypothetical protein
MDARERHLLAHYLARIAGDVFEEADIYAFVLLLRPYASEGSSLREFGDFMAHRERTQGTFRRFLITELERLRATSIVETDCETVQEAVKLLRSAVLFPEERILRDLNETLRLVGGTAIDTARAGAIVACLISLLQDASFLDGNKNEVGRLVAAFDADLLFLLAEMVRDGRTHILIPVLRTPNVYQRFIKADDRQFAAMPNEAFTLLRVNGKLRMHSE